MAANNPNDKQEKLRQLQEEINKLSGEAKRNWQNIYRNINQSSISLGELDELLQSAQQKVEDLTGDLSYLNTQFSEIVDKLKNGNKSLQFQETIMSRAVKTARETLEIRKGETYASASQVKILQKEVTLQLQNLLAIRKKGNLTDEEKEKVSEQIRDLVAVRGELDDILKRDKEINAELGIGNKILGQLDSALSKLGVPDLGFGEAYQETLKLGQAAKAAGVPFNASATFTSLIKSNIKSMLNPLALIATLATTFAEVLISTDKSTGDLAKQFDLTYQGANNVRQELTGIANRSMDAAVTTKGLQESMVAIGQALGVNAQLNEKDLTTFTKLREQAGFTNEELVAIQRTTLATGGSLEDNAKSFLGTVAKMNAQNKLAINAKQLLKEVANVSDAIKLSVGGTAAKLAEAAFKAKQFGINLEQADKISESLLDFENSINNEISAELITGKDLNFERARLLAINGKIAEASAEILQQVGGTAEFTKMNRIQQEAIAKAVGMTRDDLAKSLVDREAAQKLGAAEGQSAQDRYNELVKAHGVERANAMLGDESLARQFQQQSAQERFTAAVEKLKEIFVSIAEPVMAIISPIVDILSPILSVISGVLGTITGAFGGILKYLTPIIAGLGIFLAISKAINTVKTITIALTTQQGKAELLNKAKSVGTFLVDIGKYALEAAISVAKIPFVGPILAIGAMAAAVAGGMALYSKFNKGDDIVSPGYGKRTLLGPEGAIALNNKDTVLAGTNLFPKENNAAITPPIITPPPSPAIAAATVTSNAAATTKQDNTDVINALKEIKNEQAKANTKPTIIQNSMNGTNFGTAVATNTFKTQ